MPVTPWLAHPDGTLDVGLIAGSVPGIAAWTTLPPRSTIRPMQLSYSPLRRVSPESRTLVGRAHVLRTSPYWVYAEGTIEDGDGRIVADTSGHFLIRAVDFAVPDDPPVLAPVDRPSYPTPAPHERPLAADRYAALDGFFGRGGVEAVRAMIDGEVPMGPLYELLGIFPTEVGQGTLTSELHTSGWLASWEGHFGHGPLMAFLGDTCGVTTWTVAGPGMTLATLHLSASVADLPHPDGRTLRAQCQAEWVGGSLIVATLRAFDGDKLIAAASMTTRAEPAGDRPPEPPTRVLATVLFTDIVDSTAQAQVFGDARWNEVLGRHHEVVRREVERARGRLVKSTGDGVLVTFDSPTLGVGCAKAIRDAVRPLGIEIRAGLHTGDVEVADGDVAGIAVHMASRIEAAAGPGEVWVSETVRALCAGSDLSFKDQGRHALKGIDDDVRLWSVED